MTTSTAIEVIQASAGTSNWYRTPAIDADPYVFTGTLVSGDTVTIQVSNDPAIDLGFNSTTLQSTTASSQVSSSQVFSTTNFSGSILGTWKWWRIVKTGTAGNAVVQMR